MDETFHSSSLVIPYLDTHSMSVKFCFSLICFTLPFIFCSPVFEFVQYNYIKFQKFFRYEFMIVPAVTAFLIVFSL